MTAAPGGKAAARAVISAAVPYALNGAGSEADQWPEPDLAILSPHSERPPPLPTEVFGRFWAKWIKEAAQAKGAPVDYVAAGLLSSTSAIVATRRRASPWDGWFEPPIFWTALIGLPSSNKSPAQDAPLELIRGLEVDLNEDWQDRKRRYETDRETAKVIQATWESEVKSCVKQGQPPPEKPDGANEPEFPQRRRFLANDCTPEALISLSAATGCGIVYNRDELPGWFGSMDKYGGNGAERALWLEAHGGRPFTVDRMKHPEPISCECLAVCLTGCIQPDRLASILMTGDDDGLAARFIYVWPEPVPISRPENAPDAAGAKAALRRLAELASPRVDLRLEEAAVEILQEWRRDVRAMEGGASGLFLSWLGKLPGLALRLGLILELLWWSGDRRGSAEPTKVSAMAMQAAVGFLEGYCLPMARRAFGDATLSQAEKDAIALARWLMAQRPRPSSLNARELYRARVLGSRDAARCDAALAELAEAGWLRQAPAREGSGSGRPRKDWAINPSLGAIQ